MCFLGAKNDGQKRRKFIHSDYRGAPDLLQRRPLALSGPTDGYVRVEIQGREGEGMMLSVRTPREQRNHCGAFLHSKNNP